MFIKILLALLITFSTLSISACLGNGGGDGCNPPRHWVKHWIHSDDGSGDFEYQICE